MTTPDPAVDPAVDRAVDGTAGLGEDDVLEPLCPDVQTWVEHVYAPVFIRRITPTQRWCPSWWAHAEAIVRLTALWRSWEAARASAEEAAMADWLRGSLDQLNPVLLAPDGPFSSCTPDRHTDPTPMPLHPAPPGYWADTD